MNPHPINYNYLGRIAYFAKWNGGWFEATKSEDLSLSIRVSIWGFGTDPDIQDEGYYEKRVYDIRDYYQNMLAHFRALGLEFNEEEFEKSFMEKQ